MKYSSYTYVESNSGAVLKGKHALWFILAEVSTAYYRLKID